jgi:hypothetical protein
MKKNFDEAVMRNVRDVRFMKLLDDATVKNEFILKLASESLINSCSNKKWKCTTREYLRSTKETR